jgi:hypothetical protein
MKQEMPMRMIVPHKNQNPGIYTQIYRCTLLAKVKKKRNNFSVGEESTYTENAVKLQ